MTTPRCPSPLLPALLDAAFHNERVAARRLAAGDGLDQTDALRRVLAQSATAQGLATLDELLAARAQLQLDQAQRRATKLAARAEQVARRKARTQPAPQPGLWQAWFDGSAHPNPGRLGIGGLLLGPAGEQIEISQRAGHGNSGEAEYLALLALLEAALAVRPALLAIYGDSQVVIGDVASGERLAATREGAGAGADVRAGAGARAAAATNTGAKGLEQHRAQALALLAQLRAAGQVTLHWVPRHRNGKADRLSQQAITSWAGLD